MFGQFGAVKFDKVLVCKSEEVIAIALISSASSSRKACFNSSVRGEMMWSAGAGGFESFF